jgi:hypothetical protein
VESACRWHKPHACTLKSGFNLRHHAAHSPLPVPAIQSPAAGSNDHHDSVNQLTSMQSYQLHQTVNTPTLASAQSFRSLSSSGYTHAYPHTASQIGIFPAAGSGCQLIDTKHRLSSLSSSHQAIASTPSAPRPTGAYRSTQEQT